MTPERTDQDYSVHFPAANVGCTVSKTMVEPTDNNGGLREDRAMIDDKRNEADIDWSQHVAASIVEELLVAKLITEDQAEWAREIVAQDIHIKLVSGYRPPNSN